MCADKLYWIGFNLVKGVGAVRVRALLEYFGDLQAAWRASPDALLAAGLNPKVVQALVKVRADVNLEKTWERIVAQGIQVLTWEDEEYPRRLKELEQAPPVLYVRGTLLPEDEWAVAVVGTRRITAYGRQVADEVATTLARNGVTVVSGLARGVDGVAHAASLKAKGRTVAVLGSGVDRIYPPEHRRLADEIIQNGAVVSDYAPGTPPDGPNFPPRNRIISGLAKAVVVVEAGKTSGALITAAFAAEQGREVFAVPGNIYAPQSQGANLLIQNGTRSLLDMQDLLEVLNLQQVKEFRSARMLLPDDPVEAQLYSLLGAEPRHMDDLCADSGMPVEKVSAALAMMEIKGYIRPVGGMNFVAVREPGASYLVD